MTPYRDALARALATFALSLSPATIEMVKVSALTREIPLTQGKEAIVDLADFDRVSKYRWYAIRKGTNWYAARSFKNANGSWRGELLHRFILGLTEASPEIDHKDGNGLNCTRANLRTCSRKENVRNSRIRSNNKSHLKGVDQRRRKWRAQIKVNGRKIYLGLFSSPELAAAAYDAAAIKYHGEFARLNFPNATH